MKSGWRTGRFPALELPCVNCEARVWCRGAQGVRGSRAVPARAAHPQGVHSVEARLALPGRPGERPDARNPLWDQRLWCVWARPPCYAPRRFRSTPVQSLILQCDSPASWPGAAHRDHDSGSRAGDPGAGSPSGPLRARVSPTSRLSDLASDRPRLAKLRLLPEATAQSRNPQSRNREPRRLDTITNRRSSTLMDRVGAVNDRGFRRGDQPPNSVKNQMDSRWTADRLPAAPGSHTSRSLRFSIDRGCTGAPQSSAGERRSAPCARNAIGVCRVPAD
jgi:hypothetical protein